MSKLSWLLLFVLGYWSYCIFWGWKGARQARTATDYFLANRSIGVWVFVLAATATSFSSWTFVGHPGSIYSVGLPYAFASFYAITIPLTGVIFLKRQWLHGRRYGYITPGEMFSDYYRTDWMRLLTVVIALVFSVPYLGIQLRASGLLFSRLLEGTALQSSFVGTVEGGAILLSVVVFIYVASGGLRSVDCAQCILLSSRNRHPWDRRPRSGWRLGELQAGTGRPGPSKPGHGRHSDPSRIHIVSRKDGHPVLGRIGWPVDGTDDPHVHVRPHGNPVGAGFFDVGVCQQESETVPVAAGLRLFRRHQRHPVLFYRFSGIERHHSGSRHYSGSRESRGTAQ